MARATCRQMDRPDREMRTQTWYRIWLQELSDSKQSRRQAERQWLKTGWTIHQQTYSAAKCLVTTIVHKAMSTFFCTQIANNSSGKQLFSVCIQLSAREKKNLFLLPTHLANFLMFVFCDYFTRKVTNKCSDLDQQTSSDNWVHQPAVYSWRTTLIRGEVPRSSAKQ